MGEQPDIEEATEEQGLKLVVCDRQAEKEARLLELSL